MDGLRISFQVTAFPSLGDSQWINFDRTQTVGDIMPMPYLSANFLPILGSDAFDWSLDTKRMRQAYGLADDVDLQPLSDMFVDKSTPVLKLVEKLRHVTQPPDTKPPLLTLLVRNQSLNLSVSCAPFRLYSLPAVGAHAHTNALGRNCVLS